jgi:hypothetical protein
LSLLHIVYTCVETHADSYAIDTAGFSPGVKTLIFEADHSSPSNAEVRIHGAIPPLPSISSWLGA